VSPGEVSLELAWREGMLSFEDVSLRQAADQFARYSDTHIFFSDPAIGNETVTGLFAANDPVGFARSVALSLDLQAYASANNVVLRR
jgi:transmembrane sensor